MTTAGEVCAKCGAPLVNARVGVQVTCTYCGFVQRIEPTAGDPALAIAQRLISDPIEGARRREQIMEGVRQRAEQARRTNRIVGVVVGVIVLLALLGVGISILVTNAPGGVSDAPPSTPPGTSLGARPLRASELATWTDTQFHTLETTGMPGTFAAVDPVAVAPWALSVAQAWAPDAQIDRVETSGVTPTGTVDTRTDGMSVQYVLVSPARRAAFAQMQRVSDHPTVIVFLRVRFADGVASVSQTSAGAVAGELPPPVTVTCPLASIVAAARANGLALRPHYDVSLQSLRAFDGTWVWRWYVSAPTGTSLEADVYDPATCALLH